ncbi:MAG: hypothetical protein GF313_03530 [Caldithrix sp.]|nr:hypothetical protein [Caldithrix sp.]
MKNRAFFGFIFWALLILPLCAQEYGDISDEELLLKRIAQEPEANAVVLINNATIKITPNFKLETVVHRRFKILTEAGKDYANINIHFWHEDKILKLEAASYSVMVINRNWMTTRCLRNGLKIGRKKYSPFRELKWVR